MPHFFQLKLKNFKSYKDEICIEWMQFSSIIGPNGAGKSSIVDAIEFVFCFPRYSNISVQRLKEVICNRLNINDDNCTSTWVRIIFHFNGKKTVFQRLVHYTEAVHKYYIDDTIVNIKNYKNRLLEFNINGKANNFLVQQNSIENVAMRGAKERCEFFEHICNSIMFKEEYICLSKELNEINLEIEQSKKDLNFQYKLKRELIRTSKKLEKNENLRNEFADIEFNYYFSKLYKIDKTIEELLDKQKEAKIKIKVINKIKKCKENNLLKLKDNINDHESILKILEEKSEIAQNKFLKYSSKISELTQKLTHCEKNIKKIENNLIQAEIIDQAHEKNIINLKRQYCEIEKNKESYESSQSQLFPFNLKNKQYQEYLKLKSEAQKKIAQQCGSFDYLERERDSLKTKIDEFNYETRLNLLSEKIEQEKLNINRINLEIDIINEKLKNIETSETQIQIINSQLEYKIHDLSQEMENLCKEIEFLEKEISDSSVSKEEDRKIKRKQEVLLKLKSYFPGVHDRLKNLCKVSQEQYRIPVMKIIGKKMDNIVVDNRFTATKCIHFLKNLYAGDKFSTFETFLPLDYISKITLDNIISRKMQDERNVNPLSTAIIASEDIKQLLNHYFNVENIIICETDDFASNLSFRKKLDCISLNGTYYKRDGSFSGGLAELLQQLKKWNYKEYENLKENKQKKYDSLQELRKQFKELHEQKDTSTNELKEIQRLLKTDLKPLHKKKTIELKIEETKLRDLENELLALTSDANIKRLQTELEAKNIELEKIENQKNVIEDKIFAKFCKNLHITNIRQYEQGDFKNYIQRMSRKKEYEILLDKIENEIEFEQNRDTKSTVTNLKVNLNELKDIHLGLKESEKKLKNLLNKNKLNCPKDIELKSIRKKIQEINKELKSEYNQCQLTNQDLAELDTNINSSNTKISNLTFKKHKLLLNCKINNINVPLRSGTIDKIVLKSTANIITESNEECNKSSDDSNINVRELEIDYSSFPKSIIILGKDDLDNHIISLKNKQIYLTEQLEKFNLKFNPKEKLKLVEERMKILNDDMNKKLAKIGSVKKNFNEIKTQRTNKFNEFFYSVAEKIDEIFKALYNNQAAQAYLNIKNPEEPYLDGIEFSCIIPKKKFVPMENLSGGEKTMSAVALLLAIYRVKPAPFLIFDEIDAALDNSNINKMANYFLQLKSSTQLINISHHEILSSYADSLIGINLSPYRNSSYVIHIDLCPYQVKTTEEKCIKNNLKEKLIRLKSRLEEDAIFLSY